MTQRRKVLGDWGTTRLRLLLLDEDRIVDRRDGPGIGALVRSPAETLTELVGDWNDDGPLRVVLAGMAGSRTGLSETPYATTPARHSDWMKAARHVDLGNLQVTVAAGLRHDGDGRSDVMRGEENQIYGALSANPALSQGSHLIVLPGTHSKWVEVDDGSIVRFHTALTGELFALLRDHSILLRTGARADHVPADADAGFAAGVARACESDVGLVNNVFEARTAQLLRGCSRSWATAFLSGLVIGEEIRGLSRRYAVTRGATLIGDARLSALYTTAFTQRQIATTVLDGESCALRGLQSLDETEGATR